MSLNYLMNLTNRMFQYPRNYQRYQKNQYH
jgi:hypothetical protein